MNEENETTEQTAVDQDPKEAPKEGAPAESGAAQTDDLDALLAEFDTKKAEAAPVTEPKKSTVDDVDVNVLAVLEQRLNDQEAREKRRELDSMFNSFTEGVQADAVDAEAFLNAMALREPRINQAYINRGSNPKGWEKVESTLKQEFQKRYGKKVDKQVTESREAVASAVRSASTAAPHKALTDKEISTMPKDDFDKLQRELGITPV